MKKISLFLLIVFISGFSLIGCNAKETSVETNDNSKHSSEDFGSQGAYKARKARLSQNK